MKTPDWNDVKLGAIVVLISLLKSVGLGFKKFNCPDHGVIIMNFWHPFHICQTDAVTEFKFCVQMQYGQLLLADQKLCWNAAGVTEYNSL